MFKSNAHYQCVKGKPLKIRRNPASKSLLYGGGNTRSIPVWDAPKISIIYKQSGVVSLICFGALFRKELKTYKWPG